MDKLARRGHNLFCGELVLLEKSKKERIRKLSAIGRGEASSSFEMGCDVSDDEELLLPSKRLKLPKKFLDDCNGVHLGSVPRKLRSAMKKRHRQSTSLSLPNPRKLMSGTESLNCNGVNKPFLKLGNRFPKETISGPITKDEEEVVETLYALAGLVLPNNETNGSAKADSENFDANANASTLPESNNIPTPAVEVGDMKMDPVFSFRAATSSSPCSIEGLAKETDQVDLLNKPSTQYQPELPNGGKLCVESDNNPQNQINTSTLPAKVEQCNEKPFDIAINFRDPSELSLDSRLKQTVQQQTSVFGRKPEIAVELGTNIWNQVQKHDMLQESRNKGSGLWPGLSSNVSPGARSDRPAATLPPWMDAPCSTSKASGSSFAKVTKVVNGRRSCKKTAAHVYISHLIQSLNSSEKKDKLMLQPSQITHEGSRQGAFLGVYNCTSAQSGLNEAVSSSSLSVSTAEIVPDEAKNGMLQEKKLYQDQPSSSLVSGAHTSPKQIFDFLSLSAGAGSSENNDSFTIGRHGMELLAQAQLPNLHSPMQHHNLISLTRSRYNSSAPLDSPSVAQQGQLLPSYGNPIYGPQANTTALTKQPSQHQQLQLQPQQQQQQQHLHLQQHQHQHQQQMHLQQQQQHQQQHQQRFWAAQFAAEYRQGGTLAATASSPSWQNIKQDNCTLIQCGQALLSPSPSTLELVGPKYTQLSQHQQQLVAVTSFPAGRVNLPDCLLPSVFEESVGGYRAASALPLQLLCNERL